MGEGEDYSDNVEDETTLDRPEDWDEYYDEDDSAVEFMRRKRRRIHLK